MKYVYVIINIACLLFLATGWMAPALGENEGVILASGGIGGMLGFWMEVRHGARVNTHRRWHDGESLR